MKRRGFTLVELLIIIAIIGVLSATMMVGVSNQTAKAKATTIANNVDAMKLAASDYYIQNMDDTTKMAVTTSAMLDEEIPTWRDYNGTTGIKYTPEATVTGRDNWAVTVDFSGDGEADTIKTALSAIKGYGKYKESDAEGAAEIDHLDGNKFKVTLWNGKIEKVGS